MSSHYGDNNNAILVEDIGDTINISVMSSQYGDTNNAILVEDILLIVMRIL
jgi:hypothetical protein